MHPRNLLFSSALHMLNENTDNDWDRLTVPVHKPRTWQCYIGVESTGSKQTGPQCTVLFSSACVVQTMTGASFQSLSTNLGHGSVTSVLNPLAANKPDSVTLVLNPLAASKPDSITLVLNPLAANKPDSVTLVLNQLAANEPDSITLVLNPLAANKPDRVTLVLNPLAELLTLDCMNTGQFRRGC